MTALWEMDAITLAGMLRGREVSAREVIAAHIERIEAVDPAVNAAPDLSGGDEVFRTWRALRFATAFGSLLHDHPGDVGPNVTWNVERGLELTVADLSRATTLWAGLAERISAFFLLPSMCSPAR